VQVLGGIIVSKAWFLSRMEIINLGLRLLKLLQLAHYGNSWASRPMSCSMLLLLHHLCIWLLVGKPTSSVFQRVVQYVRFWVIKSACLQPIAVCGNFTYHMGTNRFYQAHAISVAKLCHSLESIINGLSNQWSLAQMWCKNERKILVQYYYHNQLYLVDQANLPVSNFIFIH
jgi:hypothetical protein